MKHSWNLEQLKREGMQTESALHGVAELSGEVNNVGQYSKLYVCQKETSKSKVCYFMVKSSVTGHVKSYKAKKSKCNNCKKIRHHEQVSRSENVSKLELDNLEHEFQQIHTHNDYDPGILKTDLLKINV